LSKIRALTYDEQSRTRGIGRKPTSIGGPVLEENSLRAKLWRSPPRWRPAARTGLTVFVGKTARLDESWTPARSRCPLGGRVRLVCGELCWRQNSHNRIRGEQAEKRLLYRRQITLRKLCGVGPFGLGDGYRARSHARARHATPARFLLHTRICSSWDLSAKCAAAASEL